MDSIEEMDYETLLQQSDLRDLGTEKFIEHCDCLECKEVIARLAELDAVRATISYQRADCENVSSNLPQYIWEIEESMKMAREEVLYGDEPEPETPGPQ